jgi:hypothetical protein
MFVLFNWLFYECYGVFMKELSFVEMKEVSGAFSPIDVIEEIIDIITDFLM